VTDPTIRSLLEDCASSPADYFDPSIHSELAETFRAIAARLRGLRTVPITNGAAV
jgi:hypothetical protein